ncbi:unnamed protein product [Blepharisma stoltei]|uniref:Uncharacterized protein n=1 Tax=Blepharisma stoltei TaxID=1481888 RepID=A0AAU9IRC1_9CILI|nr:unnamed protein product [Blepharisma stoltei]
MPTSASTSTSTSTSTPTSTSISIKKQQKDFSRLQRPSFIPMNHRFAFLHNRPLEKLHICNFSSPKNNSSLQEFMLTHISSPLLFAFSQSNSG